MQHPPGGWVRRFIRSAWRNGLILGILLGMALSPIPARATNYTSYNYTNLDRMILDGNYTARGINDSGQIIGSFGIGDGYISSFIYGSNISIAVPSDPFHTYAEGISNRGQVVGAFGRGFNLGSEGFLYNAGSYTTINVPGATATQARGINDSGQIVGNYYIDSGIPHGFLYQNGSFTTINVPGTSSTYAAGINDRGQIVGSAGNEGFIYDLNDPGSFTTVSVPGADYTYLYGINNHGQILGGFGGSVRSGQFIYDDGTFTDMFLDLPFPTILGLNDSGDLVGFYEITFPSQFAQAFLAVPDPVPEPGSLALLAPGLVALFALRRRRR